jgi:hypothetical protein
MSRFERQHRAGKKDNAISFMLTLTLIRSHPHFAPCCAGGAREITRASIQTGLLGNIPTPPTWTYEKLCDY